VGSNRERINSKQAAKPTLGTVTRGSKALVSTERGEEGERVSEGMMRRRAKISHWRSQGGRRKVRIVLRGVRDPSDAAVDRKTSAQKYLF